MREIYVIPFTIWEREYLLDSRFTLRWWDSFIRGLVRDLLDYLNASRNPISLTTKPLYMLDGQIQMLRNWLIKVSESSDPKLLEHMNTLLSSKVLISGPIYTQTIWEMSEDPIILESFLRGRWGDDLLPNEREVLLSLMTGDIPPGVFQLAQHMGIKLIFADMPSSKKSKGQDVFSLPDTVGAPLVIGIGGSSWLFQLSKVPTLIEKRLNKVLESDENTPQDITFIPVGYEYEMVPEMIPPVVEFLNEMGFRSS